MVLTPPETLRAENGSAVEMEYYHHSLQRNYMGGFLLSFPGFGFFFSSDRLIRAMDDAVKCISQMSPALETMNESQVSRAVISTGYAIVSAAIFGMTRVTTSTLPAKNVSMMSDRMVAVGSSARICEWISEAGFGYHIEGSRNSKDLLIGHLVVHVNEWAPACRAWRTVCRSDQISMPDSFHAVAGLFNQEHNSEGSMMRFFRNFGNDVRFFCCYRENPGWDIYAVDGNELRMLRAATNIMVFAACFQPDVIRVQLGRTMDPGRNITNRFRTVVQGDPAETYLTWLKKCGMRPRIMNPGRWNCEILAYLPESGRSSDEKRTAQKRNFGSRDGRNPRRTRGLREGERETEELF